MEDIKNKQTEMVLKPGESFSVVGANYPVGSRFRDVDIYIAGILAIVI